MIRVTVTFKNNFPKAEKKVISATREAMMQGARDTLVVAKLLVPLDEGPLRASGRIEKPDKNTIEIIFGGDFSMATGVKGFKSDENVDYAIDQHETTWYNHAPGRTDHYLSIPFNQMKAGLPERIRKSIKRRF